MMGKTTKHPTMMHQDLNWDDSDWDFDDDDEVNPDNYQEVGFHFRFNPEDPDVTEAYFGALFCPSCNQAAMILWDREQAAVECPHCDTVLPVWAYGLNEHGEIA